ncbi:hypothetical protein SVAN01_08722 [Stagonosporopsis vannaccii]|nr:hypothetical protein SVAN01_08722 [Stagonosporopsis vannaccii]
MPSTALFVIDIQHALALSPSTSIPHASRVVTAGTAILARARTRNNAARANGEEPVLDIVVVQHEELPEEGNLQRGSRAWELVFPAREGDASERLVAKGVREWFLSLSLPFPPPLSGEGFWNSALNKGVGDTFTSNPRLADELRASGVKTIVAFGIQSECCVLSTCRGALRERFRVVLLRGAHGTYDMDGKTAAEVEREVEDVLAGEGAEVVGWEDWMV